MKHKAWVWHIRELYDHKVRHIRQTVIQPQSPKHQTDSYITTKSDTSDWQLHNHKVRHIRLTVTQHSIHKKYLKHKLNHSQRTQLQHVLDDYSYTCRAKLKDSNLGDTFMVEKSETICVATPLYYSAGFEPICVYCDKISHLHVLFSIFSVLTVP